MALVRTNRVASGYYRLVAVLQSAVPQTDAMGGRLEPSWPQFGTWRVSVTDLPFVKSEQDSTVLHLVEGLWRQDIWDRFYGQQSLRIVVNGMTLKPLALVNPVPQNRKLQVHAANIVKS